MGHSLRYEVNCSILFTELPLLQRPAAAKAAGFDAVEFWWPFVTAVPADAEVDEFITAIDDAGVSLVGLNFFAGDMPGGDRGLVSWPARSAEFRDNIPVVAAIGERLVCKAFNALYGNRVDGADPDEQDDLGTENLALAAQGVAGIGGTALLEPVSGATHYPLLTAADVAAVIARVSADGGPFGHHGQPDGRAPGQGRSRRRRLQPHRLQGAAVGRRRRPGGTLDGGGGRRGRGHRGDGPGLT